MSPLSNPAINCQLDVDVQYALLLPESSDNQAQTPSLPDKSAIDGWVVSAYEAVANKLGLPLSNALTVRIVEAAEMTELNHAYRGKNKPTNVLSFAFEVPQGVGVNLLGDIVICHDVVAQEAQVQGKQQHHHYAHMLTHGVLHLCGYDHQCDQSANEMEALEIAILQKSGIPNPYE